MSNGANLSFRDSQLERQQEKNGFSWIYGYVHGHEIAFRPSANMVRLYGKVLTINSPVINLWTKLATWLLNILGVGWELCCNVMQMSQEQSSLGLLDQFTIKQDRSQLLMERKQVTNQSATWLFQIVYWVLWIVSNRKYLVKTRRLSLPRCWAGSRTKW